MRWRRWPTALGIAASAAGAPLLVAGAVGDCRGGTCAGAPGREDAALLQQWRGPPGSGAAAAERGGDDVLRTPFWMYDDPVLYMPELRTDCKGTYGAYDPDAAFIERARTHPMRVRTPEEAAAFVVPIPVGSSWLCGAEMQDQLHVNPEHERRMKKALRRLVSTDVWKSTGGHRHIWMAFHWKVQYHHSRGIIPDDVARGIWADRRNLLKHITLLTFENVDVDWAWGCVVVVPYVPTGVKLPAGAQELSSWETETPSFDDWSRRETLLFYHVGWAPDSQEWGAEGGIRRRPLVLQSEPDTHIGERIGEEEHIAGMRRSKFCIVTRGGSATSHHMYDAMHSLCLPVLISDDWDSDGKPFPELVPWDRFLVRVNEDDFMRDPHETVKRLRGLDREELRSMLSAAVQARQALDWRAPGSLATSYALETAAKECHGRS